MATKKTKKPAVKKSTTTASKTATATEKKITPNKQADAEFDRIMEEMKKEAAKEEAKKTSAKKSGGNGWTAFWLLLAAGLIIFLGSLIYGEVQKNKVKSALPELINFLGGGEMTLQGITDFKKEDGVYKFDFVFAEYPDEPFTSYISKDGKTFFVSGYDVQELRDEIAAGGGDVASNSGASAASCDSIAKAEAPELTAYIVADCPYGTQMQSVMVDAIAQAPELKDNFKVRYFFTDIQEGSLEIDAMHGKEEAEENLRQICIREEQPALYWDYAECYASGTASDTCLTTAGVNATTLNSCMTDANKGIAYAIEDNNLADLHNVSGSPTLIINDQQQVSESAFGGRNADGLKNIVCCSADNAFSFCDAALTTETAAANGNC